MQTNFVQSHTNLAATLEEELTLTDIPNAPGNRMGAKTAGSNLVKKRGAKAVIERIRLAIETGVYADGDQIPPERELATAFGAARSTIRKALNELEAEGLVVRRVGSGTFVSYSEPVRGSTGELADLISPLQLIDARLAIEPFIARLATLNATQRDVDTIAAILDRLDGCAGDKELFSRDDEEFHISIARCARNPLLLHICEQINDIRARPLWAAIKETILTPERITEYCAQHREIFEALQQRDGRRMSDLMRRHLEKARHHLMDAQSG